MVCKNNFPSIASRSCILASGAALSRSIKELTIRKLCVEGSVKEHDPVQTRLLQGFSPLM